MSTDLDPTQLAIEFLRRDKTELKEEIYFAWRLGVH
ncbi:YdiH family protein [Salmonella enterica]|nr:YdiH family protein [Salmonella enterica]